MDFHSDVDHSSNKSAINDSDGAVARKGQRSNESLVSVGASFKFRNMSVVCAFLVSRLSRSLEKRVKRAATRTTLSRGLHCLYRDVTCSQ
ncbi:hypothetical protein WA026_021898 [Henosepilachna vigintioctopunctata]|uniref:Uncharacterized protein n=1 Tax=Henosepilachna vigintioctopunctata TaxID=420089 RepID=A0AAW1UJ63_9CUCU